MEWWLEDRTTAASETHAVAAAAVAVDTGFRFSFRPVMNSCNRSPTGGETRLCLTKDESTGVAGIGSTGGGFVDPDGVGAIETIVPSLLLPQILKFLLKKCTE